MASKFLILLTVLQTFLTVSRTQICRPTVPVRRLLQLARIQDVGMCDMTAFGDPHISSFGDKRSRTCSNIGAQVYLKTDQVVITAYNALVRPDSEATAITQINMQLMDQNGIVQANYSAGNSQLPTHFESGVTTAQIDGLYAKVEPVGRHVRVTVPASGVAVVLSNYKHTYPMLLVRGPEYAFRNATGLLMGGCTEVPREKMLRRKRRVGCVRVCSGLSEERREACLYDCDMTGDPEFARHVNEDLETGENEAETAYDRDSNGGRTDNDDDTENRNVSTDIRPFLALYLLTIAIFLLDQ